MEQGQKRRIFREKNVPGMRIGGLQRLTLVDYPDKVAAVVFTQGCNFRCGFCHNPHLVSPALFQDCIPEDEIFEFLDSRQGKIQGVVVSGGEPTLQPDLADFVRRVKELGFKIKLDTNGSRPAILSSLLGQGLIDYVAMDIKTSLTKYAQAIGVPYDIQSIQQSIDVIMHSGVPYQFRTTLVKSLCTPHDLIETQRLIKGAPHYVVQAFVDSPHLIDHAFAYQEHYSSAEVDVLKNQFDIPASSLNTSIMRRTSGIISK